MIEDYTQKRDAPMITRLSIAMEALRQIEEMTFRAGFLRPHAVAEEAIAAICAAPVEIELTKEEATLCLDALNAFTGRQSQRTEDLRGKLFGEVWGTFTRETK